MQDSELLSLLRCDPQAGMTALIDAYLPLVCSIIRARLSHLPRAEIEELASDVLADFYVGSSRFDPALGTIKAYLCASARHKAVERARALHRTARNLPLDDESLLTLPAEGSVEEEAIRAVQDQALLRAVDALPEPDREIIVRKFLLGEPSKAIAARLGMTVSAIDTRTHRALKKLRETGGTLL